MIRHSLLWLGGACLVAGPLLAQTPPPQFGNICFPDEFSVVQATYLPASDDMVFNHQWFSLGQGRNRNDFTVSAVELIRIVERFDLGVNYLANYVVQPDGSLVLDQCFTASITDPQVQVCLALPGTAVFRQQASLGGLVPVDNFFITNSITDEVTLDVLTTHQGGIDLPLRLLTRNLQGQFVTEYWNYQFGPPDPAVFNPPAGCPQPAAAKRMGSEDLRRHLPKGLLQRYSQDPAVRRLLGSGSPK